ncbi:cysteine desulfurase [Acetitomaculum ruminis DSM 5522]|uniref:Cysteine desulfurase n=1 Tax=Acetitomaculum ruminis DSM 5522 TaxID=1120918 RepID=A0A1I0ZFZ1_9FIRM|nr:cysteine desulfurase family protein [Acetitomaculum ruminis]SFB24699.1 cysteine desulfurase [Acetitomaculum ruminis DSM 5522]
MECYLDNSATTRVKKEVADLTYKLMTQDYGNPSSMHLIGMKAENYVKEARNQIAATLKAKPLEIIFTSGGTESNNLAIIQAAFAKKRSGNHIITSKIEHPSVSNTMKYLEENGFEVTYLDVDSQGKVLASELEKALRPDTILVSIMHVNNEIGSLMPIDEFGKIIKNYNKNILFHVDAIQSYGKYNIRPDRMGIDLLSVSGHKIHAPKGSGFLYKNEKVNFKPLIHGGGQQEGYRSGTENVPAIAGLGLAAKLMYDNLDEKTRNMRELRAFFIENMSATEGISINGPLNNDEAAPHIISVSFKGMRSEVMLHALEERGIYVSAGSACSSNKPAISKTLLAINLDKDLLDSTVRYSLNGDNNKEEIIYAIENTKEIYAKYKKYMRH